MMNEKDIEGGRVSVIKKTDLSWIPKFFKKRLCTTFVEDSFSYGGRCQCGAMRDDHRSMALGDNFSTAVVSQWLSSQHTSEQPTDAYGDLEFDGIGRRHSYFLRLSSTTDPARVFDLMKEHWKLQQPNLVVSVVGGEGRSVVKSWVRDVLRQGLVKAAQSTGAWIITGGLRQGISRCVGEAVKDNAAAVSSITLNKVLPIGIAPWGLVENRQQLVNLEGSFPARYMVRNISPDSCSLDNNHKAFLLVDDGTSGRKGGELAFRACLEDYISRQRPGNASIDIPVLNMLIAGDTSMLEFLEMSLKNSTPCLVLAGSGGLANLVSDIVENVQSAAMPGASEEEDASPIMELREQLAAKVKKYFPAENDTDKLVDKVLSIYQNKDIISIYNAKQEGAEDFEIVMLKVLVQASKRNVSENTNSYADELRLAVTWNRVDIAKSELFNGNIDWKYEELVDSMTDALENNKPQFVRLLIDSGLNILSYLTYGRLEKLYNSISDTCLAKTLLLHHLDERMHESNVQIYSISLYEVSQLLTDLLGEVCHPFYWTELKLEASSTRRKSMKKACRILMGSCKYRDEMCKHPWFCLFIWAVLQNRSEMAIFCWEMCDESVLTALAGCKLLLELSKQEIETEAKLSMKELALKFERMAHDVFGTCYLSKASHSYKLLIRKSKLWGDATCLEMAIAADAQIFFSHDGVQSLLSQIWWGDIERGTPLWRILLVIICPPVCYSNFIEYRKTDQAEKEKSVMAPPCSEIDRQYEETVFSFNDNKHQNEAEHKDSENIRRTAKGAPAFIKPKKSSFVVSRWKQFWYAPVTSFIGNLLMYFLFLFLYAYVLLVDFKPPPPDGPAVSEYVLYFWVFTLVCQEIQEAFIAGNKKFPQTLFLYAQDVWNKFDVLAISLFITGLCCRMFSWSFNMGRGILCVDYMVFTLRLIYIFAIHKELGPKIIILGKMIKHAFFFLFFLLVWLIAYGVANQALLYQYDPSPARVFRRVLYRPYLHIFGDIPVEEIDTGKHWERDCTDNLTLINEGIEPCRDTSHNWLVVILLVIFLLVTNILLINLLIATFSYTFTKVQEHSDKYWKFQRYNLIVEYHSRPTLAPPFIIFSHINILIKRYLRKVPSAKTQRFALRVKGPEANKLVKWENQQKENYLALENKKHRDSDSQRLKRMAAKVDCMVRQVAEMRDVDRRLRAVESEIEFCTSSLQWIMETLSQSSTAKSTKAHPTRKASIEK
ncbi:transient receptor potential melastatin 4b3 [Danio rerio]|eukprot:NP_001314961.1 uncharacterized protein LOC102659286 [Danio rerio]